ncbi:MAG: DNA repair protein RecO [Sedimenticola sp.]|nr:DNA repair protein RecO [Sedimenticola sp.]
MGSSGFSPAFILHRRDYANSSLLLECFTEAEGRFPVIAKGVKRRRQGGMGLLQPFTPLQVRWSGRGEVKTLTHYEPASTHQPQLSGKSLYCGFYLNELLMRMLQRNDPHERLFLGYSRLLNQLAHGGVDEALLRYFELDLLEEVGYGVTLERESSGGEPVNSGAAYRYVHEQGFVAVGSSEEESVSGETLLALQHRTLSNPADLKASRHLLRTIISAYLGGKPLKSRELFRQRFPG